MRWRRARIASWKLMGRTWNHQSYSESLGREEFSKFTKESKLLPWSRLAKKYLRQEDAEEQFERGQILAIRCPDDPDLVPF